MSPIGLHHPTETEQRFRFHDPKVWRFMDLTKFIWLLKHRELYFPRIDQLNDPWEGYITKWMYDSLVDRLGKDEAREEIRQLRYDRLFFYVSCWHIGKSESDAMWGLYCGSAEGVAIQTTFRRLVNSFNYKSMAIGPVDYIDFLDASASRFMSKRLPYAHERELRILYGDYDARAAWTRNPTYNYEQLSNSLPLGVSFRCSLSSVIENIWVHPQASSVYFEVVECVVHTLFPRLKSRLRWSEMRGLPEYVETN